MRYTIAQVDDLNTKGPEALRQASIALDLLRKGCRSCIETKHQISNVRTFLNNFEKLFIEAEPFIRDR